MGVVIRQSFWGTVIAYLGVVIGYFNTLYLRPEFLTFNQIGTFTLVTANAMLISPFCSAGMPATMIKYFPEVSASASLKNQFLTFQLLVVISLNLLVLLVGYLASDWIAAYFTEKSPEYTAYLAITAIIVVVNSLFDLLFSYCRSVLQIIVPSFIRDVQLRLGAIVLIGGFALNFWTFDWVVMGLSINYLIALLVLFTYLAFKHDFQLTLRFSALDNSWKKRIFNFGGYAMLLGLSFAVMNNVNYLQISGSLGERANGIFATCFFIGAIVEMPRRNMLKVLSPLISTAMKRKNMVEVNNMYQKGSITMTVIGGLLFIGIITNLNDLFAFIPQGSGFREGYWVVLIICGAKLFTMLFSFSQEVMVFSPYYKYALFFQVGSAIILVILNLFFLPVWGLTGAALSYLIATFTNSFIRFLFLKRKYTLSPFVKAHVSLLVIGVLTGVLFYVLPFPFVPMINIFLRTILTTLVFVFAVFKMNVSPDINGLIKGAFEKTLKIKI